MWTRKKDSVNFRGSIIHICPQFDPCRPSNARASSFHGFGDTSENVLDASTISEEFDMEMILASLPFEAATKKDVTFPLKDVRR